MGWEDPFGHTVSLRFDFEDEPVVGVVKDFHFRSLHHGIDPLVLHTHAPTSGIYVRLAPGALPEALEALEAAWRDVAPALPFTYAFLDDQLDAQYRRAERARATVRWGAGFALFIACLGLFGLGALMAQQRTREVGIRKALGATARRIAATLLGDLLRPVALALGVAAPLAYLALEAWLADFAYRATVGPGTFALAALGTLAVAALALGVHVWRTARLDPARALRQP